MTLESRLEHKGQVRAVRGDVPMKIKRTFVRNLGNNWSPTLILDGPGPQSALHIAPQIPGFIFAAFFNQLDCPIETSIKSPATQPGQSKCSQTNDKHSDLGIVYAAKIFHQKLHPRCGYVREGLLCDWFEVPSSPQ